jgi:hypothetical protein
LLTVDELEDLGGHVAARANRTTVRKLRNKLNTFFSKIQDLLETHADELLPKSLKIEDAPVQAEDISAVKRDKKPLQMPNSPVTCVVCEVHAYPAEQ